MVDISLANPAIQGTLIFLAGLLFAILGLSVTQKITKALGVAKANADKLSMAVAIVLVASGTLGGIGVGTQSISWLAFPSFGGAAVQPTFDTVGGDITVTVEDSTTTPQMTVYMRNIFDDSVSTENYLWRKYKSASGNLLKTSWTATASATAQGAVAPGTVEQLCGGITSTTDFTGNFYAGCKEATIPAEENPDMINPGADDEDANGMESMFLNRYGTNSYEAGSAGIDNKVYIEYTPARNEIYGNGFVSGVDPTHINVLVCDFNTTYFDDTGVWNAEIDVAPTYPADTSEYSVYTLLMKQKATTWQGLTLDPAPVPNYHAQSISGTGNITKAWYTPAFYDGKTTRIRIDYEADDTNAPTVVDTQCRLYSGNNYLNSVSNEIEFGVEDNTATLVGQTAPEIVTMDWTA